MATESCHRWTSDTLYTHFTRLFDENKRAIDIALRAQRAEVRAWKDGWGFAISVIAIVSALFSLIAAGISIVMVMKK